MYLSDYLLSNFRVGAIVISLIKCSALANFSIIKRVYLISTDIVRCTSFSKAISPLIASQLPSKAVPTNSPHAFITGLPEFPPVMSLLDMKFTLSLPFLSAYLLLDVLEYL